MKEEIIKIIATFMARVSLKGEEVQAYNAVMQALQEELKQEVKEDGNGKKTK